MDAELTDDAVERAAWALNDHQPHPGPSGAWACLACPVVAPTWSDFADHLAPAALAAAGAGAEVDRFRCPACGHWCVWVDDAWVCSKRGGCGSEYTPDRPAEPAGETVDREALAARLHAIFRTSPRDKFVREAVDAALADALAARGDAAAPTVTAEQVERAYWATKEGITMEDLTTILAALGIEVEGGEG